ncbi:putative germin-like protein 2-3 [Cryptomeria japonica]|uniref:putative germin-like protein 2-3 n=1 Tax=Cryptomeria japonica TaxID=3369 RepID=UPI0027DA3D07|nr:putative germin-like protein 2-3 [Cryptomeria japonica]
MQIQVQANKVALEAPRRSFGGRDDAWRHRLTSPPYHGSASGWPSAAPVTLAPTAGDGSGWPTAITSKFPRLRKEKKIKTLKMGANGFSCKDPKIVSAEGFFFSGLRLGDTSNAVGSNVTAANVNQIPGLNTLGISLVRIDYAVDRINSPHTHPKASEILVLLKGQLLVGFIDITSKFHSKVLKKGDVFVFPKGLLHFQHNVGHRNAVAISGLSSQNPGVQVTANSLFAVNPRLPDGVLTKAFRSDKTVVDFIQGKFM